MYFDPPRGQTPLRRVSLAMRNLFRTGCFGSIQPGKHALRAQHQTSPEKIFRHRLSYAYYPSLIRYYSASKLYRTKIMTATNKIDLHCPICGELNSCAVSMGKNIEECWCSRQSFSDSALADIPESQRLARCICPACAGNKGEPEDGR